MCIIHVHVLGRQHWHTCVSVARSYVIPFLWPLTVHYTCTRQYCWDFLHCIVCVLWVWRIKNLSRRDHIIYLQVRANPPIRIAEWSGDKNLPRLISLPASCVFYVTRQVCLKINMLSHVEIQKNIARLGPISNSAFSLVGYRTHKRYIFPYSTRTCVITYNIIRWAEQY